MGKTEIYNPADKPMKWFKFLIYAGCFLGALLSLTNGVNYLTGSAYMKTGISISEIYATYPGLNGHDKAVGILCILSAVCMLFARHKLASYCKNGPVLFYAALIVNTLVTVVDNLWGYSIIGQPVQAGELAAPVIAVVVGLLIHTRYFSRRSELFVYEG